jgi:hypothetical protein
MIILSVRHSVLLAIGLVGVAGCSSSDSAPPAGGSSSAASSIQLAPGMSGEAVLDDGAKISVPMWAVPSTSGAMEFRVARSAAAAAVPTGQTAASAVYDFSPEFITFARPVKLTLPLTAGSAPEQVRVYRIDPSTKTAKLVSAEVSSDGKTVSIETYHLSSWFASSTSTGGASTASAALLVTNTNTDKWINVCVTSQSLRYADQADSLPTEPIAVAPSGTIGWSSSQHWYLPQGTYNFCVESVEQGTVSTPPGPPSHILVPNVELNAAWSNSDPKTTNLSYGALVGAVSGPCDCTPSATSTSMVYTNSNISGVSNKPTAPTVFTTTECNYVTRIATYHWNDGAGKTPGTVTLSRGGANVFAPLQAAGTPGQGGVKDANWNVYPGMVLAAGTYTVVDSDPDTWSQNSESGGSGMVWVEGVKAPCP